MVADRATGQSASGSYSGHGQSGGDADNKVQQFVAGFVVPLIQSDYGIEGLANVVSDLGRQAQGCGRLAGNNGFFLKGNIGIIVQSFLAIN